MHHSTFLRYCVASDRRGLYRAASLSSVREFRARSRTSRASLQDEATVSRVKGTAPIINLTDRACQRTQREEGGQPLVTLQTSSSPPPNPERVLPSRIWDLQRSLHLNYEALKLVPNEPLQQRSWLTNKKAIPKLKHGLHKVISEPFCAVPFKSFNDGHLNFPSSLERVHQVDELQMQNLPAFMITSKDATLHAQALKSGSMYKASTSSISGFLCLLHGALSVGRPVVTRMLSNEFASQPNNITRRNLSEASVYLLGRDGIYSIDQEGEGNMASNKILSELGKSLERRLTMNDGDFDDILVQPTEQACEKMGREKAAYRFKQIGDFLLRSQIDCYHPGLTGKSNVFDIKTRALHPIRMDIENFVDHFDYKISRHNGLFNSFEREMYDMMRAAFLKYSFQLHIGDMDGAFVAYHNTQCFSGFQYVPSDFIDRCVFGTKIMKETMFDRSLKIIQQLLDFAISEQKEAEDDVIKVTLKLIPQSHNLKMSVQKVTDTDSFRQQYKGDSVKMEQSQLSHPKRYAIELHRMLNGVHMIMPYTISPGEEFEVRCRIKQTS